MLAVAWVLILSSAVSASATQTSFHGVIEKVLGLYDEADVVAYGENHGSIPNARFRIELVRHPEFARRVDVIVIESANAFHQQTLDRYIFGHEVPRAELVRVWRDTGSQVWDAPIYEEFLTAVRAVNAELPEGEKIRVLAGDMAIDWSRVESGRDFMQYADRGDFPLHIVDCEILRKQRKALLVYGSGHLYHAYGGSFVAVLDARYRDRIRVLEVTPWAERSMARLRDALDPSGEPNLIRVAGSPIAEWNLFEAVYGNSAGNEPTLAEAVDYVVYLGDVKEEIAVTDPAIFEEPEYKAARERRLRVMGEFAELFQAGDFEGYREWSEYACEEGGA